MYNNKKNFSKIFPLYFGKPQNSVFLWIRGDATSTYTIMSPKGSEAISNLIRTPQEVCCAFNRFCRKTIKREAYNACRDAKRRRVREVSFSDLSHLEENLLCTVDNYFVNHAMEKVDDSIWVACRKISPMILAEALLLLPESKRTAVIMYYYQGLNDAEIARLYNLPRSTVHYRRKSSLKFLKRYLEEYAYEQESKQ